MGAVVRRWGWIRLLPFCRLLRGAWWLPRRSANVAKNGLASGADTAARMAAPPLPAPGAAQMTEQRYVLVAWPPTAEMLARVLPQTEMLHDESSLALVEQAVTMIETSPLSRLRLDAGKHVACDLIRDYRAMCAASPIAADDPAVVERIGLAIAHTSLWGGCTATTNVPCCPDCHCAGQALAVLRLFTPAVAKAMAGRPERT